MRRCKAREPDTVTELMPDTDHLMLIHEEGISRVMVALKQVDERDRLGNFVHATL